MPELPEVETIARTLGPELVNRSVLATDLLWPRTLAVPGRGEFRRRIVGQRIVAVDRRAKYLHIRLSEDHLFLHLRMSGDVRVVRGAPVAEKHDRLLLSLSGDLTLAFNDPRKFGRAWLVSDPDRVVGKLGPEPLDEAFTPQALFAGLRSRRRQLKPLLLDQSFLAGLGNIYTDEVLHAARLHPQTRSDSLDGEQSARLWKAIRSTLQEGIRRNGASIDWVYRGGEFQNYFRVYDRKGQPCLACGETVLRIVVGQRGTYLCPRCQPRE